MKSLFSLSAFKVLSLSLVFYSLTDVELLVDFFLVSLLGTPGHSSMRVLASFPTFGKVLAALRLNVLSLSFLFLGLQIDMLATIFHVS